MARTRKSAKVLGARMEKWVADHMSLALGSDFIERRTKTGQKDRGDIGGVRTPHGKKVVIEVKNTAQPKVGPWLNEAETERVNDGADVCAVVYKRTGFGETQMGKQVVLMTLDDLIVLLGGKRGAGG